MVARKAPWRLGERRRGGGVVAPARFRRSSRQAERLPASIQIPKPMDHSAAGHVIASAQLDGDQRAPNAAATCSPYGTPAVRRTASGAPTARERQAVRGPAGQLHCFDPRESSVCLGLSGFGPRGTASSGCRSVLPPGTGRRATRCCGRARHRRDARSPRRRRAGWTNWRGTPALPLPVDGQVDRLEAWRVGQAGDPATLGDRAAIDLLDVTGEIDR